MRTVRENIPSNSSKNNSGIMEEGMDSKNEGSEGQTYAFSNTLKNRDRIMKEGTDREKESNEGKNIHNSSTHIKEWRRDEEKRNRLEE